MARLPCFLSVVCNTREETTLELLVQAPALEAHMEAQVDDHCHSQQPPFDALASKGLARQGQAAEGR